MGWIETGLEVVFSPDNFIYDLGSVKEIGFCLLPWIFTKSSTVMNSHQKKLVLSIFILEQTILFKYNYDASIVYCYKTDDG